MKVLKSYGTCGEVILSASSLDPKDINLNEPVFIQVDGLPVPFFIETLQEKGSKLLVKFEDIDDEKDAEWMVGREVTFSQEEEDEDDRDDIIGTMVFDQNKKEVGPITAFHDFSGNTCVSVLHEGEEVILPFHEELVIKVTKRGIFLTIPEGLL